MHQGLNRCMGRMRNWLQLARLTVKAEFPAFESLQLFRVFSLESDPAPEDFKRLANMLHLPHGQLLNEFQDMRPSALWYYRNGSPSSQQAWVAACKAAQQSHAQLHSALCRYLAWQANTTSIERAFSKALQSCSSCRGDVSEHRLDDEVQLLSLASGVGRGRAMALPKHSDLIESARELWTEQFGPPRNRERLPQHLLGQKRRASNDSSEASFLKKRRRDVEAGAGAAGIDAKTASTVAPRAVGQDGWLQAQEEERRFTQDKTKARFFEAVREGAVPYEKLSQRLKDLYHGFVAHDNKLSADAMARKSFSFKRPSFPDLTGATVWWTEEAQTHGGEINLRRLSRSFGMTCCESALEATVHVYLQLSSAGLGTGLWAVALHGKFLMDLRCFLSEGKQGGFVTYLPAISVARVVHITPQFARDHAELSHEILHYSKPHFRGSSKWRRELSLPNFLTQVQKAVASKHPTKVLAFGTEADRATQLGTLKLFLTAADLHVLLHINPGRSSCGLDA